MSITFCSLNFLSLQVMLVWQLVYLSVSSFFSSSLASPYVWSWPSAMLRGEDGRYSKLVSWQHSLVYQRLSHSREHRSLQLNQLLIRSRHPILSSLSHSTTLPSHHLPRTLSSLGLVATQLPSLMPHPLMTWQQLSLFRYIYITENIQNYV